MKRRPVVAGLMAAVVLFAFVAFVGVSGGMGWALVERENAIDQEKKTAEALTETKKAQKKAEEETIIAEKARLETAVALTNTKKAQKKAEKEKRSRRKPAWKRPNSGSWRNNNCITTASPWPTGTWAMPTPRQLWNCSTPVHRNYAGGNGIILKGYARGAR